MTKLGQHFLINKNKIKKAVEAMKLADGDIIIEIGPGHGELTNEIVSKFKSLKTEKFKIILIEKDENLFEKLRNKIEIEKLSDHIEIIKGDALKIIPQLITNHYPLITNYKIVGNIPYYITGYLFRIIGELKNKPSLIVFTIQKEVAQRICAKPPKMNLLAASVQFWAEPEIISYVSKKDFRPIPKVDSAIIKLKVKSEKGIVNSEKYYKFIKVLFKQPRKTILNNVLKFQGLNVSKKEEIIEKLQKIGISPIDRSQNLDISQIIKLSTLF